jgi:hypothetical protein
VTDDVITLGPTPCEESCAQLGTSTYPERSSIECRAFRRMLLRFFPPPMDESARLVIQRQPYEQESYREVAVRYTRAGGLEYALMLERNLPTRWDDVAREELIWYTVRHLLSALWSRQWIVQSDIPPAFALFEPPGALSALLANREALYSPLHPGGPLQARYPYGEYVIDAFGPPEDARVLGPLTCGLGRGLIVRLKADGLRLYRPDLIGPLASLTDEFLGVDRFFVRKGSPGEEALRSADSAAVCRATGERSRSERAGCEGEIWQLTSEALTRAIPLSLASARERP